jgi:gluconate 2-dehydrogenase gamma chain
MSSITPRSPSRRAFVASSISACALMWMRMDAPAMRASVYHADLTRPHGYRWLALSLEEGRDVEAITAQIMPSGDGPGAREAGVARFIDHSLSTWAADQREMLREGVADLTVRARGFGRLRFADLGPVDQHSLLSRIEQSPFFQTIRFATLAGMFCRPSRGGNVSEHGWRLIGYVDRHAWQPPFGYYDAEAAQKDR